MPPPVEEMTPPSVREARCGPHPLFTISWNYYRSMWLYGIFCSIAGAIAIFAIDRLPFIDCLFLAVSAYSGSGLSTVGMQALSNGSFAVIFVLMFMGGTIFLLLPPIIWRIQSFRSLEPTIERVLASVEMMIDNPKVTHLLSLVSMRRAQIRGLRVVLFVVIVYLTAWLVIGWLLLWIVLSRLDPLPELEQRGASDAWVSAFTVLSAYANAGFTITSDSLLGWRAAASVYLPLSVLILAGNNAAPILLRGLLRFAQMNARRLRVDEAGARYALDHPRQMTTHLFDRRQTKILIWLLVVINGGQYVIYLAATMSKRPFPDRNTALHTVGAGVCQTISTRMAGFAIVTLSELNTGLLVVYLVMMYLSLAPFVSRMYVSEQTWDDENSANGWKKTTDSARDAQYRFNVLFLFRHLSWLVVVFSLIAFLEDHFLRSAYGEQVTGMSLFAILFEIVSAYGNVGLSLGFKSEPFSLSGAFTVPSKLLVISVMMLGKHRGLPAVTDITLNFQYTRLRKALCHAQEAHKQHTQSARSFRDSSLHDDFDEASVVRHELGIPSPRLKPIMIPVRSNPSRWSRRSPDRPAHLLVGQAGEAARSTHAPRHDVRGGLLAMLRPAVRPTSEHAAHEAAGVAAPTDARCAASHTTAAHQPREGGARLAAAEEGGLERGSVDAERIADIVRTTSGLRSPVLRPLAAPRRSESHSGSLSSHSASWRGAWHALWTPEDDAKEAEGRVQAWELVTSDHMISNVFAGGALRPSLDVAAEAREGVEREGAREAGLMRRLSSMLQGDRKSVV